MTKSLFTVSICCILFLTLPHPASAGPNDPVSIPDANLLAAIRTKLSKPTGNIIESDMSGMTGILTANGDYASTTNDITDLTGLEYATGLTGLNMDHNSFTDLSPIKNLTSLQEIRFSRWYTTWQTPAITDISALAGLTNLKILTLADQRVSNLTPLQNLTKLEELDISFDLWGVQYFNAWTLEEIRIFGISRPCRI